MSQTDGILRKIEKMSETRFLPTMGPEKGKILARVVREIRPKRVLEVGTLIGYSAILIGRELDADARLITIELHADEARMAEENMRIAGRAEVDVLVGDAIKIIPKLKEPFNLVFIDAEKTEYCQYLKLIEDKLHKGSVIVSDNAGIFADQMRDYLDYMRTSPKCSNNHVQAGEDELEISFRS